MNCSLAANDLAVAARLFRRLRTGSTLPALESVLVTVAGTAATLTTTNLDAAILLRLPLAGPSTDGSFTIPRPTLFSLARQADKGSALVFEADDAGTKVKCRYTLKGYPSSHGFTSVPAKDFPHVDLPAGHTCIIPTDTLHAVRRSRAAASTDETRYVLNGVYFDPQDGGSVVATDGRRMVMTPARVPHHDAILPNAAAELLVDPECTGPAVWNRDDGKTLAASLTFAAGRAVLVFKLIEGNFPNWRQVIPPIESRRASYTFTPKTAETLITWLRSGGDETTRLEPEGNAVVCTRVTDKGESRTSITFPALVTGEPPSAIAFNSRFLAEAIGMGLHTIDFIDEISPGVATNGQTRCILMPMRADAATPAPSAAPGPENDDEPADDVAAADEEE